MIIINTFPCSEAYEFDILLIKLHTEDRGVSEWVICENDYTFMGQYKGYCLQTLIDDDPRFDPFRNRITVISKSFTCGLNGQDGDFSIGDAQRNFGVEHILNKYNDDNTWVITSDIDQAYDFTGNNRTDFIYESLKTHPEVAMTFSIRKYWYDFDNYAHCIHQHAFIPLSWVRAANAVRHTENRAPHLILQNVDAKEFSAYEYSFCYPKEEIKRKLDTFGHFPFTDQDVEVALKCNHWIRRSVIGESLRDPKEPQRETKESHWFEREDLTLENAPPYVLINLSELKTNNVDLHYKENRKLYYPQYFA